MKEKNPVGRPSTYTMEIGKKICRAVATTTESLKKICELNPDFPPYETIRTWQYDHQEFSLMYAQAKRQQADLLVEQIIEISDDTSRDSLYRVNENGEETEVCNAEWIARSRLRVDTRKWIACKLLPKVYGDKNKEDNEKDDIKETLEEVKEMVRKCKKSI